jgi:hypothetical protein
MPEPRILTETSTKLRDWADRLESPAIHDEGVNVNTVASEMRAFADRIDEEEDARETKKEPSFKKKPKAAKKSKKSKR